MTTEITFKPGATDGKKFEVLCLECKRPTKHVVLASVDKDGSQSSRQEGWSVDWTDTYQVLKCLGCESVTFRHVHWFSEDHYDEDDRPPERLYPKRDANSFPIRSFLNLPRTLKRIHSEVLDCFNNNSFTMCAAGVRAMVEGICADQGITDGPVNSPAKGGGTQVIRKDNLEGKIAGLHEKGILTQRGADSLHDLRFLGNDAIHELVQPSEEELTLAIHVIEHVIEQLYEIPHKASELKEKLATRKK